MSITVTILNENGSTVLNEILYSMEDPQILDYESEGMETLNVSIQVQALNNSKYYILSLASSYGIQLPMTAVPVSLVNCQGTYIHVSPL
jgi:hypothetical protein